MTAFVNLLKTVGGRDKLYKVAINICKLLILQKMAEGKGSVKKLQDVLNDTRTVMRLGAWIENGKKVKGVVEKGKVDLPAVLEFFAALTAFVYKLCNNCTLLIGKGVPIPLDTKALKTREKWWQFWQYPFGAAVALWGKDGYFQSQKAQVKALKDGNSKDAKKAGEKMTKCLLKATHHTLDTLSNLPNVGYIPAYKPSGQFLAVCGVGSGTIVSYLQYNDEFAKTCK